MAGSAAGSTMSRRISGSLARAAVATFSSVRSIPRTPKMVLISSGQSAERKIRMMAGVSPMPKNSMASGINEMGGTERNTWIDQSASRSSA